MKDVCGCILPLNERDYKVTQALHGIIPGCGGLLYNAVTEDWSLEETSNAKQQERCVYKLRKLDYAGFTTKIFVELFCLRSFCGLYLSTTSIAPVKLSEQYRLGYVNAKNG